MKVFLIGAAGGIGIRLTQLLTARGDETIGMHRKPEQAEQIAAAGRPRCAQTSSTMTPPTSLRSCKDATP